MEKAALLSKTGLDTRHYSLMLVADRLTFVRITKRKEVAMHRVILRFPDLKKYEIENWVTFKRWRDQLGAPAGFELGLHARGWYEDTWEDWVASRAEAAAKKGRAA